MFQQAFSIKNKQFLFFFFSCFFGNTSKISEFRNWKIRKFYALFENDGGKKNIKKIKIIIKKKNLEKKATKIFKNRDKVSSLTSKKKKKFLPASDTNAADVDQVKKKTLKIKKKKLIFYFIKINNISCFLWRVPKICFCFDFKLCF